MGSAGVQPEVRQSGPWWGVTIDQRWDLKVGPSHNVPTPPRRRRWRRRLAAVVVVPVVLSVLGLAVAWPLTPSVSDAQHRVTALLAAHHATPLDALPFPDRVGEAVIATEDSRFPHHWGVDPLGVLRAALSVSSTDQGGATLDQQLAKLLWTGNGGLLVKAEQVVLSAKLEQAYSKSTILRLYLQAAYFGHGYYGLVSAAQGYFGRSPSDLSWGQASLLAGLVQAPSAYDPYRHLERAKLRQHHVLRRLVATHVLTQTEANAALTSDLRLR